MLDITPFLDHWAYPLLALLLVGGGMWVIAKTSAWLDAHASFLNATTRQKILAVEKEALDEGAGVIMAQAKVLGGDLKLQVDNPIVRFGAQVAINHADGMLADHGADPAEVAAKLLARLPPVMVGTDTTGVTLAKPEIIASEQIPAAR